MTGLAAAPGAAAGLAAWVAAASLAGLLCTVLDKRRAVRRQQRVPERTLLALAVAGGSPGVWAGMLLARHKTRKPLFAFGVPLLLAGQAWAAGVWLGWW